MTNAMQERTSPSIEYITTLSVNLQSTDEDSGLYTVTFNISSGDFIIGFSATKSRNVVVLCELYNWASEASPTLGCSIEISRDIYIYVVGMSVVCQIDCVGGIT